MSMTGKQALDAMERLVRDEGEVFHLYALATLRAELDGLRADAGRLDYIERTFSGMTNRERYLPVQMIWGKGSNGRTLREACDKYMARDAARQEKGHE